MAQALNAPPAEEYGLTQITRSLDIRINAAVLAELPASGAQNLTNHCGNTCGGCTAFIDIKNSLYEYKSSLCRHNCLPKHNRGLYYMIEKYN